MQKGVGAGSNGKALAQQAQGPKFKPKYCQKHTRIMYDKVSLTLPQINDAPRTQKCLAEQVV
jgi:hypothetical protein